MGWAGSKTCRGNGHLCVGVNVAGKKFRKNACIFADAVVKANHSF
jgi:hypothetical protein